MVYIRDLLNKIKWDEHENPDDYTFSYEDRVLNQLIEKKFTDIKKIEINFIVLEWHGEEISIPISRIKVVKKQGNVVWQTRTGKQ